MFARFPTAGLILAGAVALSTWAISGCAERECRTDGDCAGEASCVRVGVFFGGSVCVGPERDGGPPTDVDAETGTPPERDTAADSRSDTATTSDSGEPVDTSDSGEPVDTTDTGQPADTRDTGGSEDTTQMDTTDGGCERGDFDVSTDVDSPDPLPDPIAYWPFDTTQANGDGLTVFPNVSSHTNVPDAVAGGAEDQPTREVGVVGGAAGFDADPYLVVDHVSDFELAEATIMFWFRTSTPDVTQGLVTKDASGQETGGHFLTWLNEGEFQVRLQSQSTSVWLKTREVDADRWYHVAISFGPNGNRVYLDGNRIVDNDFSYSLATTDGEFLNREPIVVGANNGYSDMQLATPVREPLSGRIDELVIFDEQIHPADYFAGCLSSTD